MPLHRSYDVTAADCEEDKSSEKVSPHIYNKNWLFGLLIFFVLCVVVLLLSILPFYLTNKADIPHQEKYQTDDHYADKSSNADSKSGDYTRRNGPDGNMGDESTSSSTANPSETTDSPAMGKNNDLGTALSTANTSEIKNSPAVNKNNDLGTAPSTANTSETTNSLAVDKNNDLGTAPSTANTSETTNSSAVNKNNDLGTALSTANPSETTDSPAVDKNNDLGTALSTANTSEITNSSAVDKNNDLGTALSTANTSETTNSPAVDKNTDLGTAPSTANPSETTDSPAVGKNNDLGTAVSTANTFETTNSPAVDKNNDLGTALSTANTSETTNSPAVDKNNDLGTALSTANPSETTDSPAVDKNNDLGTALSTANTSEITNSSAVDKNNDLGTALSTANTSETTNSPAVDKNNDLGTAPSTANTFETTNSPAVDKNNDLGTAVSTANTFETTNSPAVDKNNDLGTAVSTANTSEITNSPAVDKNNDLGTAVSTANTSEITNSPAVDKNNDLGTALSTVNTSETTNSPAVDENNDNGTPPSIANRWTTSLSDEISKPTNEPMSSTSDDKSPNDRAKLGMSRQRASKMLSYMNHVADPCEDLYEFACGELETNSFMLQKDLNKEITEKIFGQAEKMNGTSGSEQFLTFYKSCMDYEMNYNESERIRMAAEAVAEVGSFDETDANFDLTNMLSKLLLRNNAPLFDITPDIAASKSDCENPSKEVRFTFKIGPSTRQSILFDIEKERECYNKQNSERLANTVDLYQLYKNHTECKVDIESFLGKVEKELKNFPGANAKDIRIEIDYFITETMMYSAENEIRENYSTKNYTEMTVKELQSKMKNPSFLNWTQLLESISHSTVESDQRLQIYSPERLFQLLNMVDDLGISLKKVFLGLYVHKVYNELVVPRPDENHCKSVTINLMKTYASSLYLSSFSAGDHEKINATVMKMFEELKDTLESSVKDASLDESFKEGIIRKIHDLSIAVPDPFYYERDSDLDLENSENQVNLSTNYFQDTMMLQKNSRKSMYDLLGKSSSEYKKIWTYFAQPYQTSSSTIYALNKVILPYGIIDWFTIWSDNEIHSENLAFATLGTRIAQGIAHHFDPTGINYSRNVASNQTNTVFCKYGSTDELYSRYKHKYESINGKLVLLSTNQTVAYKTDNLSLNERFSEDVGLQLAYDTMLRRLSNSTKPLPWWSNEETNKNEQFLLAYAQMFCTKVPLTSSYTSLYEDEHLPSRLKISVLGCDNKLLGKTWGCPEGSSQVCFSESWNTFPNVEDILNE